MNAVDPLAQLRDIHLPPPVSAWPPAPGWWLLAIILALLLIAGVALIVRGWRRRAYRRTALRQLQALQGQWRTHGDDAVLQQQLNRLLKQVALAAYPRTDIAALHGEPWLQFLDARLRRPLFGALPEFGNPYRAGAAPVDATALVGAARTWIRRHRR